VLWGAAPVFSAIQFNEKTPVLHLIPRRGGKPLTVPLPKRMHSHFFNAFEEDGSVVVDTIGYPWCATARTDRDVTIHPGAYVWLGGLGKLDFEQNDAEV